MKTQSSQMKIFKLPITVVRQVTNGKICHPELVEGTDYD